MCLQVAEQQTLMLERVFDVRLPARYRDYVTVKRNYRLHGAESVVSAAEVSCAQCDFRFDLFFSFSFSSSFAVFFRFSSSFAS